MIKNWKSTLMSILAAVLYVIGSAADHRAAGGPAINFNNLAPAIGIAAIGALAKDHDSKN